MHQSVPLRVSIRIDRHQLDGCLGRRDGDRSFQWAVRCIHLMSVRGLYLLAPQAWELWVVSLWGSNQLYGLNSANNQLVLLNLGGGPHP